MPWRNVAAVYGRSVSATVSGMAIAVSSAARVRIWESSESEGEQTVRNDGPGDVTVSRNPLVVVGGADAFVVKASSEERVWLRPGDGLFAVCASGVTASVEVI